MRQSVSQSFRLIGIGVAALALALLVTLWPGAALAKDHPQITLNPSKGAANTQVAIAGTNFPAFCGGVIFIDDSPTNTVYGCDSHGSFQSNLAWPDGLDDGKHTISARGFASSAQATFTQITGTPTPDATATAAVNATATASAGQATATASAVQSTATASAPTPTKSVAAAGAGNATPPTSSAGLSPGMLGMILVASLLLIAGGVLLALALSNRRQGAQGLTAHAYRPAPPPPPPPPSDATLPQGEQWIWPNDPYRR